MNNENTNKQEETSKLVFIQTLQKDLVDEDFYIRDRANLALLSYDLGRSKNECESDNARNEYNFRNSAFVCLNGIKEAMRTQRRQYERFQGRR